MYTQLYHLLVVVFSLCVAVCLLFQFCFSIQLLYEKNAVETITKHHLESIHSKDHSWQGQLIFSDVL